MRESQYRREVTCRWLEKAVGDLRAAQLLLQEEPDYSSFHSQQAAEKALKAVLVALGVRPPKTHSLELLAELIARQGISIENLNSHGLETLSGYAVEARYPDFGEEPTPEEAREALEAAKRVVEWAKEKLREMGIEC